MRQIYAIANQKGGVGKSTTCVSLGAAFAEQGRRVLLIDCDPHAGLTTSLGYDPDSFHTTLYDTFTNLDKSPLKKALVATAIPNLSLIPANLDLSGVEVEHTSQMAWERTLTRALEPFDSDFDYLFLDCPPSLGVLTVNALMASHRLLVPVQTEYLALRSLKQLQYIIQKVRKLGNPALTVRFLRTMHDGRTIHSKEVLEELKDVFKAEVYDTIIKRSIKFADATAGGEPILTWAKKHPGAEAYRQLAQEILHDA